MFASMMQKAVRKLLSRFIHDVDNSESSNDNGFNFCNIMIKEEVINEHIKFIQLKTNLSRIDSISVEFGWKTTIIWRGIHVKLEKCANETCISTERVDDTIGSSLLMNADSSNNDDFLSSFIVSPIEMIQKKFESVTSSIVHQLYDIKVELDCIGIMNVVRCEISEQHGIECSGITLTIMNNVDVKISRICVDKERAIIESIDININVIQDFVDFIQQQQQQQQQESHTRIELSIRSVKISVSGVCVLRLDDIVISKCLKNFIVGFGELFYFGIECEFHNIQIKLIQQQQEQQQEQQEQEQEQSVSPFDHERIFLFHAHTKPNPVANSDQITSFIECTKKKATYICNILIEKLYIDVHEFSLPINVKTTTATTDALIFAAELLIKDFKFVFDSQQLDIHANQCLCFFDSSTQHWTAKIQHMNIKNIGEVKKVRLAGDSYRSISSDIACVNVESINNLISLLNTGPKNPDQNIEFMFRIKMASLSEHKLIASSIEIFTLTTTHDIIITLGGVCFEQIIASSLQIQISEENVRITAISISGAITPEILSSLVNKIIKNNDPKIESEKVHNCNYCDRIIHNYMDSDISQQQQYISNEANGSNRKLKIKCSLLQMRLKLILVGCNVDSFVELHTNRLKFYIYSNGDVMIKVDNITCYDKMQTSVWNKAAIFRKLTIWKENISDFKVITGIPSIVCSFDQTMLDHIIAFAIKTQSMLLTHHHDTNSSAADPFVIDSLYISPFKARIDYKPNDSSSYFNFVALRGAVVKIGQFDCYDSTVQQMIVKLTLHTINEIRNVPRLISAIKPLRTPAYILRNITELVLVPMNAVCSSDINQITAQARRIGCATIVSIMEIGSSLNLRRVDNNSVHANQPSGIKDGFYQAATHLKQDLGTVFAFISGDLRNVDLFELPLMMLRPVTSPISDIMNGTCNQIDRERYQRLKDKYR